MDTLRNSTHKFIKYLLDEQKKEIERRYKDIQKEQNNNLNKNEVTKPQKK